MLPVGVWLLASNLMSFNSLDGAFEMVKGVYLGTGIDATTLSVVFSFFVGVSKAFSIVAAMLSSSDSFQLLRFVFHFKEPDFLLASLNEN